MAILPRQYYDSCPDGYYYRNGSCYSGNSRWGDWGRWVVLAAIIVGAFFLFFACACITARRRRRHGMTPYRGTGWAAGNTPAGHGPAQYNNGGAQPYYNNNYQQPNNAAPPYSGPNQGYYGGNQGNQGYFGGGQQNGVELQQPTSTYQPQTGGDPVYSPPAGPPPGKHNDGIIR